MKYAEWLIILILCFGFYVGIVVGKAAYKPRLCYPGWDSCDESTLIHNGTKQEMLHCFRTLP